MGTCLNVFQPEVYAIDRCAQFNLERCYEGREVSQKTAQNALQSVQHLACKSSIGAMRTCSTAALEVVLNLPPF